MRLKFYLAGAMEAAKDLGAGWRVGVTEKLHSMGHETLDPCLFEPDKLKGLHTKRLPDTFTNRITGETITPTHWHQLKLAKEPTYFQRFLKYMRLIIKYDIDMLVNHADAVICLWNSETSFGAGTHSELSYSYLNNIPVYCVETHPMPAWALGCCTQIFKSFEELYEFLDKDLNEGFAD